MLPLDVLRLPAQFHGVAIGVRHVDRLCLTPRGRSARSMTVVGLTRTDGNGASPARHSSPRTGSRPSGPQEKSSARSMPPL
ncbi:hypothetical protein T261_02220 [Streptomyces lydicus]|nr:hypothetical protein T261_02220 [Streptomyces lydicus]